jgi:prohibitin 2
MSSFDDEHLIGANLVEAVLARAKYIVIAVGVLVLAWNSIQSVGAGERGVVFSQFGGVKSVTLGEGLQFKLPFIETIIPVDVKIQKAETNSTASSRDLQTISAVIAVNYHVVPDAANQVYQSVGLNYRARVIDPAVQESMKAVAAQFTAEELITRRAVVSNQIQEFLADRLLVHNISVDEFSIVDFGFSNQFNLAIEAKQTAEQNALKAERDLDRVKIEAEQLITQATAEAESQRLQRATISVNILQLRAIEKWDGTLPQVTGGGGVPFINLETLSTIR